jgi:hypothetical protein
MKKSIVHASWLCGGLLVCLNASAQERTASADNGTDPTKFVTIAEGKYEYLDLQGGFGSSTLRLSYTQPFAGDRYNIRARLPVASVDVFGDDDYDIGDFSVEVAHVFGLNQRGAWVAKGEMVFDTAARPELGTGQNVLKGTLIYAKFLGANHKRVAGEVAQLHNDLAREVASAQEERFWLALMAVVISGARYANELGLTEIDLPALRAFMIASLKDMRNSVKDAPNDVRDRDNLAMILQGFLGKQRARNMLVTDNFPSGAGRPKPCKVMMDVTKLDRITVHRAHDTNTMRISQAALIEYLDERNHPSTTFIKALADEMGATRIRAKLGAGTELASAAMAEQLLEIDFNNGKLKGVV